MTKILRFGVSMSVVLMLFIIGRMRNQSPGRDVSSEVIIENPRVIEEAMEARELESISFSSGTTLLEAILSKDQQHLETLKKKNPLSPEEFNRALKKLQDERLQMQGFTQNDDAYASTVNKLTQVKLGQTKEELTLLFGAIEVRSLNHSLWAITMMDEAHDLEKEVYRGGPEVAVVYFQFGREDRLMEYYYIPRNDVPTEVKWSVGAGLKEERN